MAALARTDSASVAAAADTALIGIGNSGRQDDGLAWAFLDAVDRVTEFSGSIEYRYQLQVEDAEFIRHFRHVIFVDASRDSLPEGFDWKPCTAVGQFEFTTHQMAPQAILYLCRELYGAAPTANLLAIGGEFWELQIGLSEVAQRNLQHALRFFREQVLKHAAANQKSKTSPERASVSTQVNQHRNYPSGRIGNASGEFPGRGVE